MCLINGPITVKPEGGGGRATHGNLTVTYIPRVAILIGHHVSRVGNFGMVAILDNGESKVNHLLMFCIKVQLRLWYVIYCFPLLCNKE